MVLIEVLQLVVNVDWSLDVSVNFERDGTNVTVSPWNWAIGKWGNVGLGALFVVLLD